MEQLFRTMRPVTRNLPRFIVFVASVALCGGAGLAPAKAQPLDKIAISLVPVAAQGPTFIAKERGYFKDEGLDATLLSFDNSSAATVAVVSGSADVSGSSPNVALYNLAAQGGIKIIAGLAREKPGLPNGGFVATNAAWDAGLKTLKDLKGKRIGISALGSATHYDVGVIAEKFGFSMSDVTLVPLQSLPNEAAAFKGNQVDAVSAPVPLPFQLAANNGGHILGWEGDVAPVMTGLTFANPASILNKRSVLQRYLRAMMRGANDYVAALNAVDANGQTIKGPGFNEIVAIIAKYTQAPVSQLLSAGFPFVDPTLQLDVPQIDDQIKFWRSQGAVTAPITGAQIVDTSFLK